MNQSHALHEPANAEKDFDLAAILDVFLLYRHMMLWIFGTLCVLGLAAVLLSDPQYEADMVTQVDESSSASTASSLLGQDLSSMLEVKSSADTEMQVLRSRLVVAAVVDELGLYIEAEPVRFPLVGRAIARASKGLSRPGLLGMGGYTWGEERAYVERFDTPSALIGSAYSLTVADAGAYRLSGPGLKQDVVGRLGATETFMTDDGPLTLCVGALHAAVGARFKLTRQSRLETIGKLQDSLSISEQGKDSNVLRVKLRGADPVRITEVLNHLAQHYLEQNEARKAEQAARSLAFLRGQVPGLRDRLDSAEKAYAVIRSKFGSVDLEGEAKKVLQLAADNEIRLATLQQKKAEALTRFAPTNPTVTALDRQLAVLQSQSSGLNQQIDGLPEMQRQVVKAERDVKISNDLYVGLLNNIEQLQILQVGRVGNVRVLDEALLPDRPVRFWRFLLCLAVIAVALLAAVGAAFIRDLLFHGISDSRELAERTGLDVLSVVPVARRGGFHWSGYFGRETRPRRPLAFIDPADPAIESLRSLRTALQFSLSDGGGKRRDVHRAVAECGQIVYRVQRRRGRGPHWQTCAVGRRRPETLRTHSRIRLHFGSRTVRRDRRHGQTGRVDPQAGALDARLPAGVVVDTAPLLPVPDAAILAPYSNGNIFLVARASVTKAAEMEECMRRLQHVGVAVKGVVLNGIDRHAGRFRNGTTYGTYRYGRSRGEDARPMMDGAQE